MTKFKNWLMNLFLRIYPISPHNGIKNPLLKDGWKLIFNDEFNGNTLDESKWFTKYTDTPNPFRINPVTWIANEYYDNSAIKVKDGSVLLFIGIDPGLFKVFDWNGLVIDPITKNQRTVVIKYKTGILCAKISDNKQQSWKYGYFELRCKMPSSKGTWPSFWLSGSLHWPPEIDIFEVYTSKAMDVIESNYHCTLKDGFHYSNSRKHKVANVSEDFHIYACEWDGNFVKWFYDNQLIRIEDRNIEFLNEPMILNICNGVDPGHLDQLQTPTVYTIDYVRIYTKI